MYKTSVSLESSRPERGDCVCLNRVGGITTEITESTEKNSVFSSVGPVSPVVDTKLTQHLHRKSIDKNCSRVGESVASR